MALKQYYPTEEDELEALEVEVKRLGTRWLVLHERLKKLEAKKEPAPERWWSKMSWKR